MLTVIFVQLNYFLFVLESGQQRRESARRLLSESSTERSSLGDKDSIHSSGCSRDSTTKRRFTIIMMMVACAIVMLVVGIILMLNSEYLHA